MLKSMTKFILELRDRFLLFRSNGQMPGAKRHLLATGVLATPQCFVEGDQVLDEFLVSFFPNSDLTGHVVGIGSLATAN